jgi:hypothetical protein
MFRVIDQAPKAFRSSASTWVWKERPWGPEIHECRVSLLYREGPVA